MSDTTSRETLAARFRVWFSALLIALLLLGGSAEMGALVGAAPEPAEPAGLPRPFDDGEDTTGNRDNTIEAINRADGRLLIRGGVQINTISGPDVEPVNFAYAYSSCTDCQTFAVALQVNLIGRDSRNVVPQNVAIALNESCTRCRTVAKALQYVYTVDDPTQVPDEVFELVEEIDEELEDLIEESAEREITVAEAEARINAVVEWFYELAAHLNERREEDDRDAGGDDERRATPSPTAAPPATETPTPTASATATPAATATFRPARR